MALIGVGLGLFALAPFAGAQARKRPAPASAAPAGPTGFYVTTRPPAALQNKQVVLETTLGTIVMQQLRGLAARPPYFANGSAQTLREVVDFYDRRYNIGYTEQEKQDLVNFMGAL